MTSVVDNNIRKISPKPPVLSPKPNSSEVVKRLSFKREGQDVPAKRQAAVNSRLQEEQEAVAERERLNSLPEDNQAVQDRKIRNQFKLSTLILGTTPGIQ